MNEKKDILTKTWVVAVLASICCMLWGSAFSCVKIGYSLMNITTNDSGSQLVFGGIRFFVAGLMALAMGSGAERKILLPTKTSIPKIMIISLFQQFCSIFLLHRSSPHNRSKGSDNSWGERFYCDTCVIAFIQALKAHRCKNSRLYTWFSGIIVINLRGLSGVSFNFLGTDLFFFAPVHTLFHRCI